MTKQVISTAQAFLTMTREDRNYKICDLEFLLRRHPPEAAIGFLRLIQRDFKRELKRLIRRDKSNPRINHIVVILFRLKMAINTIRNAIHREMLGRSHKANPISEGYQSADELIDYRSHPTPRHSSVLD